MRNPLPGLMRRLGRRYLWLYLAFDAVTSIVIGLGTIALFSLYEPMSWGEFLTIALFSEAVMLLALAYAFASSAHAIMPVWRWLGAGRPRRGAIEAWYSAVAAPRRMVVANGWKPYALVSIPIALFVPWQLDLSPLAGFMVLVGTLIAVAYASVLHFFASEVFLRPVVQESAGHLPSDFAGAYIGVPVRWRLLAALPIINVITGVVVSGLNNDGASSLVDMGLDVVIAVLVAFTVSLELTVLVAKSVLRPVDDLIAATERVKEGHLDARAKLTSGDELGLLAGSFNEMMAGVSEREALREAFGSYVDPDVAERVLDEGALLEGVDVEATVMVVDMRDFTPFAERSSAQETVARLNELFEVVVPVVLEHGGHANKFLGDGVLAVFGAPERFSDHADRAVSAGVALVEAVNRHFAGEVHVGVGINSGPVVVGSVGGGGRLEFAVIGDAVNVAARVEECTKDTGDPVLLTEATRTLLERSDLRLEKRTTLELKGVSEPVRCYAPVGMARIDLDGRSISGRAPLTADA
ncbi:MAG TPA: adenylate/guanylate cyclase domain-containing protein [Thermoleophilaceae bacterium]|nr:adenylate/guanylate cyclase domain-containing protein [Thermoleophilaceae bacterium]